MGVVNGPSAYKESKWPYQWIGSCKCDCGIRCNDEAEVKKFINRHKACYQLSRHTTGGES